MIDRVEGKKKTLGYVTGHKEPPLSVPTSPITVLKTFIENENIKFQELNLLDQPVIPADVNAVIILGPQYDFSDREMNVLRDFWDKQGRILLLIDPAANTPRLRAFLDELGVRVNDDRLMVFVRTGIQEPVVIDSDRSEEHTSELQSLRHLVCRLLIEKKNQ